MRAVAAPVQRTRVGALHGRESPKPTQGGKTMLTSDYLARMEAELYEQQMEEEWEQWESCALAWPWEEEYGYAA